MRRNIFCGLILMILFGGVSGCGKEDPEPQQEDPFKQRMDGVKDSSKDRGFMFPKGQKPGSNPKDKQDSK
jgi:hypothetical protein